MEGGCEGNWKCSFTAGLKKTRENGPDPAFREAPDKCITGTVDEPGSLSLVKSLLWVFIDWITVVVVLIANGNH